MVLNKANMSKFAFVILISLSSSILCYPALNPTIELSSKVNNTSAIPNTNIIKLGQPISFFAHQNVIVAAPMKGSRRDSSLESRNSNSNAIDSLEEDNELFDEFYDTDEADPAEEIIRKKLCPNTPSGKLRHLYDRKAEKCAPAGTKGHCGDNMIFRMDHSSNTSLYGFCECDYTESKTPLVYHEETDKCYYIYGRAYCQPKEWLVFNETGIPVCETRKCIPQPEGRISKVLRHELQVPLNGTGICVKLDKPSELCENADDIVHFHPYEIFPRCGKIGSIRPQLRAISPFFIQRCPPGSYVNIIGKCQPSWNFAW